MPIFGRKITSSKGEVPIFGRKIASLKGEVSIFERKIVSFKGEVSIFGGKIASSKGEVPIFGRKIASLKGEVSIVWTDNRFICTRDVDFDEKMAFSLCDELICRASQVRLGLEVWFSCPGFNLGLNNFSGTDIHK